MMFLSQYFSFPLSVSFHQWSIPIYSPTTHTIWCFSPNTSVFPCQYHSTNVPYLFIHLPPTLYNVSLPLLQFSPASVIPPLLQTHLHLHNAITRGINSEYSKRQCSFGNQEGMDRKVFRYSFLFRLQKADAKSFLEVTSCNFENRNNGSTINTLQQIA